MQHRHHDLGHLKRGDLVVVELGYAANVRLLDNTNYQQYRSGRQYNVYGGFYKRSPASITVPHTGHWHVAVDLGGNSGQVSSRVRVIPC